MLTLGADSTLATKTRSYKEFCICSTSNASHIFRFTLVNARIDTRLYIYIYIHIHSKVCKEREGEDLSYSVPLPRVLLFPYIARTVYDERQREMMYPSCLPCMEHPLFGYVFRIFFNNENNECSLIRETN